MNVLIAMDSFKGSLSSLQAEAAVRAGILRVDPKTVVTCVPIADGGEGTVDAILSAVGGQRIKTVCSDPLGRQIEGEYGILPDGTAVIEIAAAAGLHLLTETERDPIRTSSYGVGEMILDAVNRGARSFLIGLGGSSTNDGGIGMLQALGYELLDSEGRSVPRGAKGLKKIHTISTAKRNPLLVECNFRIACDVKNPLCGASGASAVFGPQKGADEFAVMQMDRWMSSYGALVTAVLPSSNTAAPGAGAAGGLGFAFMSFLGAKRLRGIDVVMDVCRMEEQIRDSDLVITGEGRLDGQTEAGKAPWGIATLAKKYRKPVIAICGSLGENAAACNQYGIDACFSVISSPCSLEDAMKNAEKNLSDTAEQVFRLLRL